MKSTILGLLVMTLLVASATRAQTADAPPSPATPTTDAPPIQPTTAEPTAKPTEAAPEQGTQAQAAAKAPKAPPGFKLSKRAGGMYVYCQEFSRVGTRFTEKVCFTPEQYEEFERRNQSMRESMQKPVACATANCNGG
jgi:glucose/arabinose dehydrogenase